MSGAAYAWYKWLMKGDLVYTWEAFLNALLFQFGTTLYEDPRAALKELKQTSTVAEYQARFEELSTKVTAGLPETWFISFFIADLKDYLRCELLLAQPQSYFHAVSLAKLHEQKHTHMQKSFTFSKPSFSNTTTAPPKSPQASSSTLSNIPSQPFPPPFPQTLSQQPLFLQHLPNPPHSTRN